MEDPGRIEDLIRDEADMAYRRRIQTIFEWLDPGPGHHLLDAGCGRGFYLRFTRYLSEARVTGLELEYPYIAKARESLADMPGITLVNGSIYDLPFPDNTFDRVILSEVLEHVPDDIEALRSLSRVVKPGGLIAITVPNANYPFWWDPVNKTAESLFGTHVKRGFFAGIWALHERLYTEEALRQVVTDSGLSIVDFRRFTHHAFPFIHNLVYGLGKELLEAGALPAGMAASADRHAIRTGRRPINPVTIGLALFEWADRRNRMEEPYGRSTVNLCLLARKDA